MGTFVWRLGVFPPKIQGPFSYLDTEKYGPEIMKICFLPQLFIIYIRIG